MTTGGASSDVAADLLIVGGGLAGVTVARALRRAGDTRSIAMIGSETHRPYDRPPLSKQVLLQTMNLSETELLQPGEETELGLDLHLSSPGLRLRRDELTVEMPEGRAISAQDVVIASGARPRHLPGVEPGPGIHYVRSRDDAERLREDLQVHRPDGHVVVVGAGFIGLEVAAVARQMGCAVTVLESAALPLARVLGETAGQRVADLHRDHGVDLRCSVDVTGIRRDADTICVDVAESETLRADIVIIGIGVNPCVRWLEGSGVATDNGVVCDAHGQSSRAHVWAAGDCARWPNGATGLHVRVEQWQAALDQAQVVATNLVRASSGAPLESWTSVPYFWSDQYDVKMQFAGHSGLTHEVVGDAIGFRDGDRATGLLTFDNPRLLARGRKVLASGGTWAELAALGN